MGDCCELAQNVRHLPVHREPLVLTARAKQLGGSVARAPVVLIVSEHEWASRSLDTILAPRGYAVMRAYNGAQAMERAASADPEAVFVERNLPDGDGLELCRKLMKAEAISPATPLIVTTSGPVTQEQRIEALRAGAWEVVGLPVDAQELVLRLDRYTRAKLEADRARRQSILDPETHLYSRSGILQRAGEVIAAAERHGRPVACVVIEAGAEADGSSREVLRELVEVLRSSTRKSDILGRIGPCQFAVVAPDTPQEGARILANRLREQTGRVRGDEQGSRAGVVAVSNVRELPLDARELVLRATNASHALPIEPGLN